MAIEFPAGAVGYAEYAAIDDGRRYEVLEGHLVLMPSPTRRHQRLVGSIWMALSSWARASGAGEAFIAAFDVVLKSEPPGVVVQPDVLFVSTERATIVTEANVQGAPDLVVEILSPSNAWRDTTQKMALYARHGVPEVWIVPLEVDAVEVHVLGPRGSYQRPRRFGPGDQLVSKTLPGFTVPIATLFED